MEEECVQPLCLLSPRRPHGKTQQRRVCTGDNTSWTLVGLQVLLKLNHSISYAAVFVMDWNKNNAEITVSIDKGLIALCTNQFDPFMFEYCFCRMVSQSPVRCMCSTASKRRALRSAFPVLDLPLQTAYKHIYEANLRNSNTCHNE